MRNNDRDIRIDSKRDKTMSEIQNSDIRTAANRASIRIV